MRLCFALIALVWLSSGVAAAEDASLSVALVGLDGQQFTLTMPEIDALPRVKISTNEHGAPHVFDHPSSGPRAIDGARDVEAFRERRAELAVSGRHARHRFGGGALRQSREQAGPSWPRRAGLAAAAAREAVLDGLDWMPHTSR